ncbi:MAG: HYR domain-containing protein, partial [Gammaproteobacteria bacterium]|nr:HYR domain-containing protein [Gammaproteobacteria bacterium]
MRVTGTTPIKTLNINCLVILAVLATACNSDSSSDVVTSVAAPDRTVSGQVAKGPLDGALVEVFAVDDHGQAQGPAIATSLTDANGNWAVSLSADDQPLLVRSSGGRYVDEADPEPDPAQRRSVTLQPDDQFEALLPPTLSSIAINAYTNALLRKSRAETQGADFLAVHATNREFYSRAFGFDLLSTIPADPIAPAASASADAVAYSQALGGIANVINAVAIANGQAIADFAAIDAVIDDLTNCSIDGRSIDGDVGPIVMVTRDLNAEILRFRNNNFAAHSGRGLLQISLAECQRSGRLPDRTAPQFSNVPASVTIAASSAAGATVAEVGAVLGGIEAIDDRDGPVSIDFGLDAPLPLGNNSLTISASDAAGNSATSTIEVVVADLDPPTITAPVSVDVMSVGVLTQVTLGAPQVADNVTATASLQVSNDAPADGFTVGIHLVTWTVSDAAGLSASAQQQVIVRNQAPVLSNAVGDQQAIEGQPFTL